MTASVAIFLLATAHTFRIKNSTSTYSYLNRRILPIAETWGSHFPDLYFILGRSQENQKFVTSSSCQEMPSLSDDSINKTKGSKRHSHHSLDLIQKTTFHHCKMSAHSPEIKVIFASNCTGNYFGMGKSSLSWMLSTHPLPLSPLTVLCRPNMPMSGSVANLQHALSLCCHELVPLYG